MPAFDPAHWERLEALLDEAFDLPAEARAAFLDRVGEEDKALRDELERLLAADEEAETFLSTPAAIQASGLLDDLPAPADVMGTRIGAWRLVRSLGEGGMGTVYLAERADGAFEQSVALKLIRGTVATRLVRERFLQERQILARLQHPHIARLLDGGATEQGQPYLVMEYVEGQPITSYCAAHDLNIPARLRLFQQIGEAVHYAHQNLIVHRDLKPSNILVTDDGTVMLLDFGIAKLLDTEPSDTDTTLPLTHTGQMMMTPEYAAPEQVRGEAITTTTDVYALGILLYELLTGARPYSFAQLTPTEIERIVCMEDPPRPSTAVQQSQGETLPAREPKRLAGELRGDLDTIVMMALRKESARRYNTVQQFIDDVARYLDGRPVLARDDTTGYRMRKFVQRHRIGVAAAALVLLSLVTGLTVALWQARIAAEERDRARLEARKASEVRDFVVGLFEVNDPSESKGQTLTAQEILERGSAQIEASLSTQPEIQAEMMSVLSEVYFKLGMYSRAQPLTENALAARRDLFGQRHTSVAASLGDLGRLHHYQGNLDDAEPLLREALQQKQAFLPPGHLDVAQRQYHLADLLFEKGDYDEAEALFREALTTRRIALGDSHVVVAKSMNGLAWVLQDKGDYEEAERLYKQALDIFVQTEGEEHADVTLTLYSLGQLYHTQGNLDEAEPLFRRVLKIDRKLFGDRHLDVAIDLNDLALLLRDKGDLDAAEPLFREAIAIQTEALGPEHPNTSSGLYNLGVVLSENGNLADAEDLLRQALAIDTETYGAAHERVGMCKTKLATTLRRKGAYEEAGVLLAEAFATLQEALPAGHHRIAEVQLEHGALLLTQQKAKDAEPWIRNGLTSLETNLSEDVRQIAQARSLLGDCLMQQRRFTEAEPLLQQSVEVLASTQGPNHASTRTTQRRLYALYTAWDRPRDAARYASALVN